MQHVMGGHGEAGGGGFRPRYTLHSTASGVSSRLESTVRCSVLSNSPELRTHTRYSSTCCWNIPGGGRGGEAALCPRHARRGQLFTILEVMHQGMPGGKCTKKCTKMRKRMCLLDKRIQKCTNLCKPVHSCNMFRKNAQKMCKNAENALCTYPPPLMLSSIHQSGGGRRCNLATLRMVQAMQISTILFFSQELF